MNKIGFCPLNTKYSRQLAEILNTDTKLGKSLGTGSHETRSPADFLENTNKWAKKNDSETFATVLKKEGQAIGLISLSHQTATTARIGYWLGSHYWGRGYATEVFSQILDYAAKKGLQEVRATIDKTNVASVKIWEKFKASFVEDNDNLEAEIILKQIV